MGNFFDLSRAFDTINFELLLEILHRYGIRGCAWKWLASYIKDRKQFVRITIEDEIFVSNIISVNSGVPQASVLGPLLFLMFINSMVHNIKDAFLTLFADDTSLIVAANDINTLSIKASTCVQQMTD